MLAAFPLLKFPSAEMTVAPDRRSARARPLQQPPAFLLSPLGEQRASPQSIEVGSDPLELAAFCCALLRAPFVASVEPEEQLGLIQVAKSALGIAQLEIMARESNVGVGVGGVDLDRALILDERAGGLSGGCILEPTAQCPQRSAAAGISPVFHLGNAQR